MAINNIERELKSVFASLDENKVVLPNFQRAFIWDKDKQRSLVASLLVNLPVGSLLVLDGKSDDFSKRKLCFPESLNIDNDCEYVLDGQQRLSTLRTVFYDIFGSDNWEVIWDKIYGKLRNRWFLKVIPGTDSPDYFGLKHLRHASLDKLVDSDIYDFIEPRQIHKTKVNELHHPSYNPLDSEGRPIEGHYKIKNEISSCFAREGVIPLYEVYKGELGIHRDVIEKIADQRIYELKAMAEDDGHSLDFYKEYLPKILVEEIESILTEDDFNDSKFDGKWASLKAKWVEQFSSDLESVVSKGISIIHLERNESNRAAAIFEAINKGGEPLTVYDLIVAKSARNNNADNLSSQICGIINDEPLTIPEFINENYSSSHKVEEDVLWSAIDTGLVQGNEPSKIMKDWFVSLLSLFKHVKRDEEAVAADHFKKNKILNLTSDDVNSLTGKAVVSIKRAVSFLQLRCGVVKASDIPYKLMLTVMAFHLEDDSVWGDKKKLAAIEYWYWCALLGGAYASGQNEKCKEDLTLLDKMLNGEGSSVYQKWKNSILNYPDYVTKDILLRRDKDNDSGEPKAVKMSMMQFVLSREPKDFCVPNGGAAKRLTSWDVAQGNMVIEGHHVIPLGDRATLGETTSALRSNPSQVLNSVLNFAYITKDSNRFISSKSPIEYVSMMGNSAIFNSYLPAQSEFKDNILGPEKKYEVLLEIRWRLMESAIKNHVDKLSVEVDSIAGHS